jgi:hypothetical protein
LSETGSNVLISASLLMILKDMKNILKNRP